jgi:DUF1680 family protein
MRPWQPIEFTRVRLTGRFWSERLETVLTRTIPSQYERLGEAGILESLELRQPPPPLRLPRGPHGHSHQIFWDSDIGKWIEAASYALQHRRDALIEARIEAIIDRFEAAQLPDGYVNFWYLGREPDRRWTNLRDRHELYNAGHLLEGAIAYAQATGRRRFLDVMERFLDHIRATFGRGEGQKRGYPGHQEIELALMRLYRLTGDRRHLDLALYFIDERGRQPHYYDQEARARGEDPAAYHQQTYEYQQAHLPVREQTKVVGHAVRAMYMLSAMADLAAETGDAGLRRACERLWRGATSTRMYVTGGFGASAGNEGFTTDYDLPNDSAYAETCAAVAFVFWAQRMLHLDLDGRYAELMERALYNGALAGLSRDGTHYFYDNTLESDGRHRRWPWHPCPCCTMNVARLLASVGGYLWSAGPEGLALHIYGGSELTAEVGGRTVRIAETSDYPWSGRVELRIEPEAGGPFALHLRIPGWCRGATAAVNGTPVDVPSATGRGYLVLHRDWASGDRVTLDLPMPPERLYADPRVRANRGRVALRRGPLVYCAEQADQTAPLAGLSLPRGAALAVEPRTDLFGGIVAISAEAALARPDWGQDLYRDQPPAAEPARLVAIPYYLWANRDPGPMSVWLPEL